MVCRIVSLEHDYLFENTADAVQAFILAAEGYHFFADSGTVLRSLSSKGCCECVSEDGNVALSIERL